MLVQGLGQTTFRGHNSRNSLKEPTANNEHFQRDSDSRCSKSDVNDRTDLLRNIKKKIKSGFYNSESVLEDLSNSFAKVLDQSV